MCLPSQDAITALSHSRGSAVTPGTTTARKCRRAGIGEQYAELGLRRVSTTDVGDDPAPDGTEVSFRVDDIELLQRERMGLFGRPVVDPERQLLP